MTEEMIEQMINHRLVLLAFTTCAVWRITWEIQRKNEELPVHTMGKNVSHVPDKEVSARVASRFGPFPHHGFPTCRTFPE